MILMFMLLVESVYTSKLLRIPCVTMNGTLLQGNLHGILYKKLT